MEIETCLNNNIIIIIIIIIIYRPAQSNCHLCVSGKVVSLQTGKNKIKAGSEIIWFYNQSYIYPTQFG